MDFQTKCQIVADCWEDTMEIDQWQWVHKQMNLGMPLAYAAVENAVSLNEAGKDYIEQAYDTIVLALGLSLDVDYSDFQEMCNINIAMEE